MADTLLWNKAIVALDQMFVVVYEDVSFSIVPPFESGVPHGGRSSKCLGCMKSSKLLSYLTRLVNFRQEMITDEEDPRDPTEVTDEELEKLLKGLNIGSSAGESRSSSPRGELDEVRRIN